MIPAASIIIVAGAFLGGFVNGLAGFGTGLVALGLWLHVEPPAVASSLVITCSVVAQCQTLPAIWRAIDFRHLWPMLVAGVIGVPVGSDLLAHLNPDRFRLWIGIVLAAFSVAMLLGRSRLTIRWGGRPVDAMFGLGGGILGGLAGLSGPLPTIWVTLRGWNKDRRRGVIQAYNLATLGVALATHAADGFMTRKVGALLLLALPGTVSGAWIGARAYRRLSDRHFDRIVLALLSLSGLTLIWSGLFGQ